MIVRCENFPTERSHDFSVQSIELVLHFGFQPSGINPAGRQTKELRDKITKIRNELIFNVGESKKDGAEEIIKLLNERESYSG